MSGDVAVREFPVVWQVVPPQQIPRGGIFTAVARFADRISPQILEAFVLSVNVNENENESSSSAAAAIGERFYGSYQYTLPGFNDDSAPSTYVWFNVLARDRGLVKFRFRLTWWVGQSLYGSLATFEVGVRGDKFRQRTYCTEHQDLLALLEPGLYEPTPVELMEENADLRDMPGLEEDNSDDELQIKTEPVDDDDDPTS